VGEIADQADADVDESHAAKTSGHPSPGDIRDESAKNGHSKGHLNSADVTDVSVEDGAPPKFAAAAVGKSCQISKTKTILWVQEIIFTTMHKFMRKSNALITLTPSLS
jgi:hypothetical protein